ncbi:MAG: M18 family aminopeptidase [Acidobacteria bacterium]|nr:M18 family aminopeptidase [Acidobacteriota bacterium]
MDSRPIDDPVLADLCAYIEASPSPFHAVAAAVDRLVAAGFLPVDERLPWPDGPGRHLVVRDGSLIAFSTEGHRVGSGFRIIGAHTDSPNLRLRPRPDRRRAGMAQLAVEIYGGVLLNSWLDRDLGLSGRVVIRRDGLPSVELLAIDEPLLRVPQLAIHLDRSINAEGLRLDPQNHLTPVWGLDPDLGLAEHLADRLDCGPGDILAWELMTHDLTPPTVLGADRSMLASARLDNLLSCHAAVTALLRVVDRADPEGPVPMICLFDHEEVGSTSASGAAGPFLETVLERISLGAGLGREEHLAALARSLCLSADGAHATHPNFPERHEPNHHITLDGGPVLKHNENRRYASDAPGIALVVEAARASGVPLQQFSSRGDLPCGSTIGPITAGRLGVRTVDLGVAQLSMHSARELCGTQDPARFATLLARLLVE